MNTLSLSNFRKTLPQIIKSVHEEFNRVTITVNGEERATVISPEELESYEETIMTLSNPKAMKALVEAEKEFKEGGGHSFEDVFGE